MEYIDVYSQSYIELARRSQFYPVTKVEILDESEFVIYEITDDIVANSDSFSSSYAQGVQSKLSFDIKDNEGKYINGDLSDFNINSKIKYYKGLKDITNNDIYYFTKGIFVITNMSRQNGITTINAVDKFGKLTSETGSSCFPTSGKIDAGTHIYDLIRDVLSMDSGNGKPLDPVTPLIDLSLKEIAVGEDIEISSGGYIGDILIELANSTRNRIYYDNFGNLRVKKGTSDYSIDNYAPVWEFDLNTTIGYLNASAEYDFTKIINTITVWGEDFEGALYKATAINNNPNSPVSVSKIGSRVGKTIEGLRGYDQQSVNDFAEFYLQMKSIQGLSVSVESALVPHLNVCDVITLNDSYLDTSDIRLMITEISISGSTMNLSLVNLDTLPYQKELQY